jgi:hypothetical protein
MSVFLDFVEFLATIGILVSLVSSYLIVNKLWKRRTTKEVAASVSISAALLGLFTSIPLFIQFLLIDHSFLGAAKTAISITTGVIFVLIGSGLFVAEYRGRGFLRLFGRALRVERRESGDLIKALIQPKGADRILLILRQLAAIDEHVDERETMLIQDFARQWQLGSLDIQEHSGGHADLLTLRQSMVDYLGIKPPPEQAGQLLDLMRVFSEADARVTWQEELALDELGAMIRRYLAQGAADDVVVHEVLIVPQSEAQFQAVQSLLPGREQKVLRGGKVFSAGTYLSPRYAELVCEKYIALGLFATQVASSSPEARSELRPAETAAS